MSRLAICAGGGAGDTGAIVRAFAGVWPRIHPDAWIAPGAVVVGDVEIGADSSLWYGSVLRGDVHGIRVGARSNLQDGCVLHVTRDRFACVLGDEVTVGHRAVVHGCRVGDGALIGIGAIVLDGAEVGAGALIGAGSRGHAGHRDPGALGRARHAGQARARADGPPSSRSSAPARSPTSTPHAVTARRRTGA